jgi:predicted O-methyltransferase YrrM
MIGTFSPAFKTDWFSGVLPMWAQIVQPHAGLPLRYLEIGVYEGQAACWMFQNVLTHPDSHMVAIDTFEHAGVEDTFRANLAALGVTDRVTVLKGRSQDVLRGVRQHFDVIYIDGSHRAADVLEDTILAWPLLFEKGLLIWDDYWWREGTDPLTSPKFAIDTWLTLHRGQYTIAFTGAQVMLQRNAAGDS